MNDQLLEDLKQFIEATTSQSEQRIMGRMDARFNEVDARFKEIDVRFNEVVDGTNQQTDTIIEHTDQVAASFKATSNDHEIRITRLERRTV